MPANQTTPVAPPPWEPTYYLKIGWTPLEVKGRMSEVDAAARLLLGQG